MSSITNPDYLKPMLSIVLPFYHKLREFERILPINLGWLKRREIELVLVVDDVEDETGVVALLKQYPQIRWKLLVNDKSHAWRPPCKAINVGLRHASGDYILVASPESAFVGDVPAHALQIMSQHPYGIALGRIAFMRFDPPDSEKNLCAPFETEPVFSLKLNSFYGSICAPRQAFETVGGYDESLRLWGGDDDNLRIRLEMAGYTLLACRNIRLVHFAFENRDEASQYREDWDIQTCSPTSFRANTEKDWGHDFGRVVGFSNQQAECEQDKPISEPASSPTNAALEREEAIAVKSRQRCAICGRFIHYDPPSRFCVGCRSTPRESVSRNCNPRTRIACVMQLRNESRFLGGCLAHVRDYVDDVITLDDGSSDKTGEILARENERGHLHCLENPVKDPHAWNELDNKQQLLKQARQMGVDWVLCCDADERFEIAFLENLHALAGSFPAEELVCFSLSLRELWNSPQQYRADGIWGQKSRSRFFRLPEVIRFEQGQALHGQWYPDEYLRNGRMLRLYHNLYHLRTVFHHDRVERRDRYKRLDPENRFQAMGYDYLAEEGDDMLLESIPPGREYDFDTLPTEMRRLFKS